MAHGPPKHAPSHRQGTLRFSVFDENEDDTEAVLGFATMPLAALLSQASVESELQLLDVGSQPVGTISISLDVRESTQPKPIQLRRVGASRAEGRTSAAEPVRYDQMIQLEDL